MLLIITHKLSYFRKIVSKYKNLFFNASTVYPFYCEIFIKNKGSFNGQNTNFHGNNCQKIKIIFPHIRI